MDILKPTKNLVSIVAACSILLSGCENMPSMNNERGNATEEGRQANRRVEVYLEPAQNPLSTVSIE